MLIEHTLTFGCIIFHRDHNLHSSSIMLYNLAARLCYLCLVFLSSPPHWLPILLHVWCFSPHSHTDCPFCSMVCRQGWHHHFPPLSYANVIYKSRRVFARRSCWAFCTEILDLWLMPTNGTGRRCIEMSMLYRGSKVFHWSRTTWSFKYMTCIVYIVMINI